MKAITDMKGKTKTFIQIEIKKRSNVKLPSGNVKLYIILVYNDHNVIFSDQVQQILYQIMLRNSFSYVRFP